MAKQGPLSGQVLGGKYLLGELLGEGGFGMVYAGQHLLLDRPQAIKLLLEHYFSRPKFRERFLREARMVAALDHPHIVHIDDFGMEEQASRAYLVMPFLGGGTFHDVLKKRHRLLAMEQVVSYIEQIGSALDYAHYRGVVHLDLKPQNLLVHEDGRLLLSDFGLAHLLKQEVVEGGTSLEYGTPHYMAPEHIRGQPEMQSDVYALGVILYQMLVGRRPFEGSTPGEVIVKHLTEPPPPLQALRPELPLELEVVVERALAKQVAQRYQSAGELVVAFKDALIRAREQARKAEEERARRAEEERIRKAEEERARKAEEERARRAEEERIRKAEEERVRKAEEAAQKAEEEPPTADSPHQSPVWLSSIASPSQSAPRSIAVPPLSTPRPTKQGISRRTVVGGLAGLAVVGVVGGSIALLIHSQESQGSSRNTSTSNHLPTSNAGFSDEFNGHIDPRWMWIDPVGDSTHTVTDQGFLRIATPHSNKDLYPYPTSNYNAPRLLQPIIGNFTVETRIRFNPLYDYRGAGILVWENDTRFLRLEHGHIDFSGLEFDQYVNSTYTRIQSSAYRFKPTGPVVLATLVDLRLQSTGNTFNASWRDPSTSQSWQSLGETSIHFDSTQVGLVLVANTGNLDVSTSADYDYFRAY